MRCEPHQRGWRRRGGDLVAVLLALYCGLAFPRGIAAQESGAADAPNAPDTEAEAEAALPESASGDEAAAAGEWTKVDTHLANHYIRLLQEKPEYGAVLDLLWDLYEKRGQTQLLLDYFRQAAEDGSLLVAKILYGHLLRKNEDLDEARALYREALEAAPGNWIALQGAAEIADAQRQPEEAILLYEKLEPLVAVETEEGVAIRQRLASLLRETGRIDEAVAIWNALLATWPDNFILRAEIVGHLMEAGRSEEAIAILRESIRDRADPDQRLTSLETLVQLYEFANDFDGAAEALREAMDLVHFKHHRHAHLFDRYVRLHERFSRLPELEHRLQGPASEPRPAEKALFLMAEFSQLTADPVREEQWVERLAEILPDDVDYRLRLVEIRMQNDRYVEAAALLDSLIASLPDRPLRLVLLRSRLALNLEGRDAAETMLREEMNRGGRPNIEVERKVLTFAREHYLDGIVEELLRSPHAAEIAGGATGSAPAELAKFLRERGRTDQAEKALWDYVNEAGASKTLRAGRLGEVSAIFRDLDLSAEAARCLDEAIRLAPDHLPYRLARVDLLIEGKETEAAIRQLEKIWASAPDLKTRTEIDQQLFSFLRGLGAGPTRSDQIVLPPAGLPQGAPIETLAEYRRLAARASLVNRISDEPPPERLMQHYREIVAQAEKVSNLANRYRAAWWAFKLQHASEAIHHLTQARVEAGPKPSIEVEKMLLDVLELKEDPGGPLFMARQLETLAGIDPENADQYLHRWAELRFLLGYEDEAMRTLEEMARNPNVSLNVLKTLASLYQKQGRVNDQVKVWQDAYRRADLFEKRSIIKQLSTTFIELGQPEGALKAQLDLIRRETDPAQKRKQFDAQLSIANRHYLLTWLRDRYREMAQQKPFDRFYPEALARIHEAAGDDEAAFLAMKRAYYMSGHDQALLAELGEMAGRTQDLKAAIYYRRQLIAQDEERVGADSWEALIEMLERDLRTPEADRIRKRLEGKFAQDADFLKGLAQKYRLWGDFAAAERVAARLTALRSWDAQAWLELGLLQKHRGETAAAQESFEKAIEQSRDAAFPTDRERMEHPPLIRGGWDEAAADRIDGTGLGAMADSVRDYPFLVDEVQQQIVDSLRQPRPEFDRAPSKKWAIRLRAIEEAGRLAGQSRDDREPWRQRWSDPETASPTERFWALAAAGESEAAYRVLESHWPRQTPVDNFVFALLGLQLNRGTEVADWAEGDPGYGGESTGTEVGLDRRIYPLVAGMLLMRGGSGFEIAPETIRIVFSRLSVTPALAWHLFDKVRLEGSPETAMELGRAFATETLARDGDFLFAVSQVAARLGRHEERRQWLERSLAAMDLNGFYDLSKSWFATISEAYNERESADEKMAMARDLVARIDAHPAAGEMAKLENRAFLALLIDDADAAEAAIRRLVDLQLASGRPDRRSVDGETFPGIQLWSLMERHLHRYASRRSPSLAPIRLYRALGGAALADPREEGALGQFEQFEIMRLVWLLEDLNPPERHRHIQAFYSRLRDPSSRVELARTLDARGFYREAIAVYRACLADQPDDLSLFRGFFGACHEAREPRPALALIQACRDGQQKTPTGMMEEFLFRNHAEFLFMARDLETLSALAQGSPAKETPQEYQARIESALFGSPVGPMRAFYQDALVRAHDAGGNSLSMLRVLEHMREQGNVTAENRLRAARVLTGQGKTEEAIAWLEGVKLDGQPSATEIAAIRKLAVLYAGRNNAARSDLVRLLNAAMPHDDPGLIRDLTGLLFEIGARIEARSCLLGMARKNRASRGHYLSASIRLELTHGAGFDSVTDSLRCLMEDLPGDPAIALEAVALVCEFGNDEPEVWKAFLQTFRRLPRARVLAEIGLACLTEDWRICDAGETDWTATLSPEEVDLFLELASRQGETGAGAARSFLQHRDPAVSVLFGSDPARQIAFLGRLGDRVRAAEMQTRLFAEAAADGFHQTNSREVAPTFRDRWTVAEAFAEAGFRDLAGALFRRYRQGIVRVTQEHLGFLKSYARFAAAEGDPGLAEEILRPAFQKSIGADPELLAEVYRDWGRLDELETLADKWSLPSGMVLRLAEIRSQWEQNAAATP